MHSLTRIAAGTLQFLVYTGLCMLMIFALGVLGLVLWNAFHAIQAALDFGR